ncbi:MAG: DUF4357 domain-containing protein [Clostridia bacterium]|nr:DUF4357 domain-containing protein [Clostridia bacterium]
MPAKDGYIYVLTNPSFPEYVKIGYADNVDERVAQLNRSECTPFAFRKYATLHVANRLADKNIHKIIDKFKPELRAKENVNGKMRIREFFAMPAEEAVDLLETIGSIYGETPQVYERTEDEKREEKIATDAAIATERRSPFSFYKCGIKDGAKIVYINDSSIICTVAGDREINYNGKNTSLTALAKKLLKKDNGIQGTLYFTYNGEVLSALRKRLEDENKYAICDDTDLKTTTDKDVEEPNNYTLLYFTMSKYPATCMWSKDGYLLLKGSKISSVIAPSCKDWVKKAREENADKINADYILTDDIMFKSSSAVATFVSASSLNGKKCWKDANGTLLKELIEKGE